MEIEEVVDKVKHEIIILSDLKEIDQYRIKEYPEMKPRKDFYDFKDSDEEKKKFDEEHKKKAIEKKNQLKNKSLDLHYKIDNQKKEELESTFGQIKLKINLSGKTKALTEGKLITLSEKGFIIYDSKFFKKINEIKFEQPNWPEFGVELDNGDLIIATKKDNDIYNYELLVYKLKDQQYFLFQRIKEGGLGFRAKYYITGHCSYTRQYHKLDYKLTNLKKISGNRFLCISNYGLKMFSLNEKNEYSLVLLNDELEDIKMIREVSENKFIFSDQYVKSNFYYRSIEIYIGIIELKIATKEELDKKLNLLKEKGYQTGKEQDYCHKYNMFGFPIFRPEVEEKEEDKKNYDDELKKIIESLKFSCLIKGTQKYNSNGEIKLSDCVILKNKYFIMIIGSNIFIFDLKEGKELKRYELLIDGIFNENDSLFMFDNLDIKKWNNAEDNEFFLIIGKNIILFELTEDENDILKLNILNHSYFPNFVATKSLQNLSQKNNKFYGLGEEYEGMFYEEPKYIYFY